MKVSKFVAILAWLNTFAMLWAMLLLPTLAEDRLSTSFVLVFFILIALISGAQVEKGR